MRRREFISLLGGAVAPWPLAARAQQPTIPVIGLLSPRASGDVPQLIAAVRQGLKDSGYVEGQNVTIEYRFAEHQNERLSSLCGTGPRLIVDWVEFGEPSAGWARQELAAIASLARSLKNLAGPAAKMTSQLRATSSLAKSLIRSSMFPDKRVSTTMF